MSVRAAAFQQKTLFLSMEMSRSNIFDRVFANLLQENSRDLQFARIPFERIAQEASAIASRWRFVNAPDLTSDMIGSIMAKSSFDLVVVDYLQLLKDAPRKGENENNRLGRISGKLKQLAARHDCVIIAAAQLNRNSEKSDRAPYLADLRDSGCIEQDADKVLLLHREKRDSTEMEAIIAKNRTGELGTVNFAYLPQKNVFKEIDSIYINVPKNPQT
jgi:replicative DNA helicase